MIKIDCSAKIWKFYKKTTFFKHILTYFFERPETRRRGKKQYRVSILIQKIPHVQYWSWKIILRCHFFLLKVIEKQQNLMKNAPPPDEIFWAAGYPPEGVLKYINFQFSSILFLLFIIEVIYTFWITCFLCWKSKKTQKTRKMAPPPEFGYTEKYLKWYVHSYFVNFFKESVSKWYES